MRKLQHLTNGPLRGCHNRLVVYIFESLRKKLMSYLAKEVLEEEQHRQKCLANKGTSLCARRFVHYWLPLTD